MILKKLVFFVLVIFLLVQFVSAGEIKKDLDDNIKNKQIDEEVSVIINFKEKPTKEHIDNIKAENAKIKYEYKYINSVSAKAPTGKIKKLADKAFVESVELDYEVEMLLDKTTGIIGAKKVWEDKGITGKDVDVAILDTGIYDENPALTVEKEVDFTGEGTDDLNGHGTHVAGIVASNDLTYKGVAYDADLFNVKVMRKNGYGYASDILKGIEWSVDNGAEIISMSLGAYINNCDGTDVLSRAVDSAVDKGVVVVVAAGNNGFRGSGTVAAPGCAEKAITVGAASDSGYVPAFSSRGPTADGRVKPDLVAPGVSIVSTWHKAFIWNGEEFYFAVASGTSMATPHVAGVAALLLEADSSLSPLEVKEVLKYTSRDLGYDENKQGSGMVDALAAVSSIFKEARVVIESFSVESLFVDFKDTFLVDLEIRNVGNLNAEGINVNLKIPEGLEVREDVSVLDYLGAGEGTSISWLIDPNKKGIYDLDIEVSSLNAGSDVSSITGLVVTNLKEIPPGFEKRGILEENFPFGIGKQLIL